MSNTELTTEELLALFLEFKTREAQVGQLTCLLGLIAAKAGGRLELDLEGLKVINGLGVKIAINEQSGLAVIELTETESVEEPDLEFKLARPSTPATRH